MHPILSIHISSIYIVTIKSLHNNYQRYCEILAFTMLLNYKCRNLSDVGEISLNFRNIFSHHKKKISSDIFAWNGYVQSEKLVDFTIAARCLSAPVMTIDRKLP